MQAAGFMPGESPLRVRRGAGDAESRSRARSNRRLRGPVPRISAATSPARGPAQRRDDLGDDSWLDRRCRPFAKRLPFFGDALRLRGHRGAFIAKTIGVQFAPTNGYSAGIAAGAA